MLSFSNKSKRGRGQPFCCSTCGTFDVWSTGHLTKSFPYMRPAGMTMRLFSLLSWSTPQLHKMLPIRGSAANAAPYHILPPCVRTNFLPLHTSTAAKAMGTAAAGKPSSASSHRRQRSGSQHNKNNTDSGRRGNYNNGGLHNNTNRSVGSADRGPWRPKRRLNRDAMDHLRTLHAQSPESFTPPVLAEMFGVSKEAARRILRSRYDPHSEKEETAARTIRGGGGGGGDGQDVNMTTTAKAALPPPNSLRPGRLTNILRDAGFLSCGGGGDGGGV